jgi:copper(I)-binding protein
MTIVNNGPEPDHLLSASSADAGAVELHETVDDKGVMRMVPHPEGWDLPARGKLELRPGGKHLMLIKLARTLEQNQTVQITLTFRDAGPIAVRVPVKAVGE